MPFFNLGYQFNDVLFQDFKFWFELYGIEIIVCFISSVLHYMYYISESRIHLCHYEIFYFLPLIYKTMLFIIYC